MGNTMIAVEVCSAWPILPALGEEVVDMLTRVPGVAIAREVGEVGLVAQLVTAPSRGQ